MCKRYEISILKFFFCFKGELGYGENKARSSTTPQEVKPLEGIHIHSVSCGFSHTLFLARSDESKEIEKIQKLPKWSSA